MSNTILEIIRSKHEEIENYEKVLSKTILFKENNPKEKIYAENLMNIIINKIQEISRELLDLYEDKNGLYKEENLILIGKKHYLDSSQNLLKNNNKNNNNNNNNKKIEIWKNFYDKLKEIKLLNKRNLNTDDVLENISSDKLFNKMLENINKKILFTTEECKGKYLDLHENYNEFINIKNIFNDDEKNKKKIDYFNYVCKFNNFNEISMNVKMQNDYKNYLKNLLNYLKEFFNKTKPFYDFNEIQDIIDEKFQEEWKIKKNEIFFNNNNNNNNDNNNDNKNNNDNNINKNKNIFCSFCFKFFSKPSTFTSHLSGKKHIKNSQNISTSTISEKIDTIFKETFYSEFQIEIYSFIFSNELSNTKNYIRKKQTMNSHEFEFDTTIINEDEVKNIKLLESNTEKKIYNPKNIPIGWDGKPVPYWLYKVFGLGKEYKCEICGGASYWGRKSYEFHFQEWRHAYGMKCLGLPNTLQFKEVCTIEDALKLHNKILENKKKEEFRAEIDEEFEDGEGNVVNRKMMNFMKKQGIN